jgi:uncharacterized damage-inducible protein DinB
MTDLAREFLLQCISRVEENTAKITACLNNLEEEQVWYRPNEASNSIGNIILHLCGNVRQYAISSLGNFPDIRERDKEFLTFGGFDKKQLADQVTDTVKEAVEIIKNTSEISLLRVHSVQGFNLSGTGIIIHVTEHYSYHTGQIIMLTKLIKNKDLGFYDGIDLNQKNKN